VSEPLPYGDPSPPPRQSPVRRLLAPLVALAATVGKWGAILFKLKFFTLVASMLASLGGYALLFGWKFAAGFVVLILIHELGHVVVLRARSWP
jgi:hypothetical protein